MATTTTTATVNDGDHELSSKKPTTTTSKTSRMNPTAATWHTADKSTWTWQNRIVSRIDKWRDDPSQGISYPVFPKSAPMPWFSQWTANRWIITHAAWPMVIHWLLVTMGVGGDKGLHPAAVFALYALAFQVNIRTQAMALRRLAEKVGFLDGDAHPRDQVPDAGVPKIVGAMLKIAAIRPTMTILLAYNRSAAAPISLTPWLPVELLLYGIVLDFFFYTYHRATHEVDGLWQYHRTHHLTKHPNPLLSAFADFEQEMIEMAIVPFLTYATLKMCGFPMSFHDWWVCQQYVQFSELFGHCGIRAMMTVPGPAGWFLKQMDCELVLEDHDLHHRKGWRKSGNYGKQTRLWDRIFGTCLGRLEQEWENVDYTNTVGISWF